MIITWIPIGSQKPPIVYTQPAPDMLQVNDDFLIDFSGFPDGECVIPEEVKNIIFSAKKMDGKLYLRLLYRCDGSLLEPEPIDYGKKKELVWIR